MKPDCPDEGPASLDKLTDNKTTKRTASLNIFIIILFNYFEFNLESVKFDNFQSRVFRFYRMLDPVCD